MISSSIRTRRRFNGLLAGASMRTGGSWMALVCLGREGANYQPKQDRMIDPQQVI